MSRKGEIHRKPNFAARQRMSQGQKGKRVPPRTEEQKEHLRQVQLGIREVYVQKATEQWQNPEIRDRQTRAILAGSHIRPTKAEYDLEILINTVCPNQYKYTGDGQVIIGGMSPDFTNINGQKKVIEMFGDYWHQGQNPQDKINRYLQYGFDCLIIWEHELRERQNTLNRIKEFNNIQSNPEFAIKVTVEVKQLSMF